MHRRTIITMVVLAMYLVSFNWFIYDFFNKDILIRYIKMNGSLTTIVMIYFIRWDVSHGYKTKMHRFVGLVCHEAVCFNLIVMFLAVALMITKPELLFYLFDGSLAIISFLLLINIFRRKIIAFISKFARPIIKNNRKKMKCLKEKYLNILPIFFHGLFLLGLITL